MCLCVCARHAYQGAIRRIKEDVSHPSRIGTSCRFRSIPSLVVFALLERDPIEAAREIHSARGEAAPRHFLRECLLAAGRLLVQIAPGEPAFPQLAADCPQGFTERAPVINPSAE